MNSTGKEESFLIHSCRNCYVVCTPEYHSYFEECFVCNGYYWHYKPVERIMEDFPYIKFVDYEQLTELVKFSENRSGDFYLFLDIENKKSNETNYLINPNTNWIYYGIESLKKLNKEFKKVNNVSLFE